MSKSLEKRPRLLTVAEQVTILTLAKQGVSGAKIAEQIGRDDSTVNKFLSKMQDSRELATAILRAGSATLAERVVKKANVAEALDVLSRPDIGVVAPAVNKGTLGPGGPLVQVSVAVASCAAVVKVEEVGPNGPKEVSDGGLQQLPEPAIEGTLVGAEVSGQPEGAPALQRDEG